MSKSHHQDSFAHVVGKSEFIDDRPPVNGELHVGVITSTRVHAKILKIDFSKALKVPGIVGAFTGKDFHHNLWGTIFQDQPVLASDVVNYFGEPIAILAGETLEALRSARKLVGVSYSDLEPILSVEEAIKRESFIALPRFISCGDVDSEIEKATHKLSGKIQIAGQEHFYLESQACIAYPGEDGRIVVHASSQHPTEVQHVVAHSLGLKYADVICVVNRMGGAFGGKESQGAPFAAMASLVTQKTGRAARVVITKDEDMLITGKRNPFENSYSVGFDDRGKITALDVQMYSDSGAYADLSTAIMERAMLHLDNAYYIENCRIRGQVCRTNFAPTTAFRGFGGPKGVLTIESIIEEIAHHLKKDPLEIRKLNCYRSGRNTTPYGQKIEGDMLPRLFEKLEMDCEYFKRRREIESFNQKSKTHIRGLSLTPIKFGISFTTRFLNQGAALVNLHMDGTVQVSTGATEMGQGVNSKISQVVAQVFGLPVSEVKVMATSTEKIHNTAPTAASSGSDINGAAALMAANQILHRLKLVAEKIIDLPADKRGRKTASMGTQVEIAIDESQKPDIQLVEGHFQKGDRKIPFIDVIEEAFLNRISLSAYGFFRYPGIHFNKETGKGSPFFYFTNGVAASEVSVDRFTGEVKVLRSDVLMDLGRRLNEGIDHGQTTGAFVQGMGWLTTEKLFYNNKGALLTISPSTYKIPSVQDTPRIFNVGFLENDENAKNVLGSKAVGEPPLMLAVSVWTAIKNALYYAKGNRVSELRVPATQEEVLNHLPELSDV